MDYTPQFLKEHLGDAYKEDAEYVIDTHDGATARAYDPNWGRVGLVPDSRLGNGGTMVVFRRVTQADVPRLVRQEKRAEAQITDITKGGDK